MEIKEMARKGGKFGRIALWIVGVLGALVLLLAATVAAGGWWLEHRYLRHEIRFGENGENRIRVHGAAFDLWSLRLRADSVWYRSPGLDARLGNLSADADLMAGLLAFLPAARVTAETGYLRLREDSTPKEKKPLDSLVFPDFKIPLAASVTLRRVTIEDDSGFLARAGRISARNTGGRKAEARADSVRSRWTGSLAFIATAGLDWSSPDSVDLRAKIRRDSDHVDLTGRHAKRPLWRGRDELNAEIAQTAAYAKALGADSLPNASRVRLQVSARLSEAPELNLRLRGAVAAYRLSEDFTLSPQTVSLSADWKNDRGRLNLQRHGKNGVDVSLTADGRRLPRPRGRDSIPLWEQAAVSVRGHARNFHVRVQDTLRSADVTLERADWDGKRLAVKLRTGDASRLEAAGRLGNKPGTWNASFLLDVNPGERWLRVFLGNDVSFAALRAEGNAAGTPRGPTASATLSARKVSAYGIRVDSLRSFHVYGPAGYELKPSKLYDKKTVWTLAGTVKPPARKGGSAALDFELSGPGHGRLRYALGADGTMEAQARLFDAGALPYALLDSLPLKDPVLDGTFRWNPARKTGEADLSAQARFKKDNLEARVAGKWDARKLNLEIASVKLRGSELNARARMRLNGRQFYQAAEVKPAQYEYASIQTPGFDIAEVLKIFQPEPALSKGSVSGELSYADGAGFQGQLVFEALTPREAVGDVVVKRLNLEGNGDTLFVDARTASESVRPLNVTLRLAVSSLLADEQHMRADIVAGDSLRIRLDAATHRFQSLRGTLTAAGSVSLPEKSGSVDKIRVDLAFDVPLTDPVNRSVLTTRAFEGEYVLPGLNRQSFSLNPSLQGGAFRVTRFSVRNPQGQALTGNLEYLLASRSLKAHVEGESFAAAWADDYKVDLRNLNLDLSRNAQGLSLSGGFSAGTFLYVDAPLYAKGRLTSVRLGYDQPARPVAGTARQRREQAPATLTFSGNISESLIRYRLKTFADLQKTFRRDRQKRSPGPPLRLNVKVQTLGDDNRIDSDILRLTWVGDLSVRGVHPYTLFNGRINALDGGLGLGKQAYGIQRFEVKWLNAPMEEGVVNMEARKQLASDCNRRNESDVDSCTVITRLEGKLHDMRFSYDSDCGGSFGAGASVAAILYSVQRGCYDASFATGGDGRGYGDKALTLLEPTLNRGLSNVVGRYSGSWIEQTEVSGLGSISREEETSGDTLGEALSLGLTSKEYMRFRLKVRSGYHTASQDLSNPWEHMLAIEWRPPADHLFRSERWKRRMRDNLRAVASLQTRPVRLDDPEEDEVEKKIGLNYAYFFWGDWFWGGPRKREDVGETPKASPAQTSGEPVK